MQSSTSTPTVHERSQTRHWWIASRCSVLCLVILFLDSMIYPLPPRRTAQRRSHYPGMTCTSKAALLLAIPTPVSPLFSHCFVTSDPPGAFAPLFFLVVHSVSLDGQEALLLVIIDADADAQKACRRGSPTTSSTLYYHAPCTQGPAHGTDETLKDAWRELSASPRPCQSASPCVR